MVILVTGKAGAGKTTYGKRLAEEYKAEGRKVIMIDADEFREERGTTKPEDFSDEGRISNLMEAAKLAAEFEKKGYIVILAFIAPKEEWRDMMRKLWEMSVVVYIPGGTLWPGTIYERPTFDELTLHALYMAPEGR
jgi:adenylylsulfate kinase-like enzyme